jgi:hypothetical protein
MQEGLYKVEFQTPRGNGAGVVILAGGKLMGGDSMMAYNGTYAVNGNQITAQVSTFVHTRSPNMSSVLGVDQATLSLKGTANGNTAQLSGSAKEAPGMTFGATMIKL